MVMWKRMAERVMLHKMGETSLETLACGQGR